MILSLTGVTLFLYLVIWVLSTSCVGAINNKIDAKVDSNVNVNASSNVNANVNTNVKTGEILATNQTNQTIKKVVSVEANVEKITFNRLFESKQIIATVKYSDNSISNDVVLFTSNKSVLGIEGNKIFAVNEGFASITVSAREDATKVFIIDVVVEFSKDTTPTPIYSVSTAPEPTPIISIPTPEPTPIPNILPTSAPISTDPNKVSIKGNVYDANGILVDGVKVVATSVDPSVTWNGGIKITTAGSYFFENAPVGSKIEISVTKDGWSKRSRIEILKSNLTNNPNINKFDFIGINAMQDEPEVTFVKINDILLNGAGAYIGDQRPLSNTQTGLSNVDSSNLKFEFGFSEAVDKEDFENAFSLISQQFIRNYQISPFTTNIDSGLNEITFDWTSDRKSVIVKTNKPVLANETEDEARYNLFLPNNALTDDTGKNAFVHNSDHSQGVMRFASKTTSDNVVFSVKNDVTKPMLVSVNAKSGGGANDTLELRFSEPLEVAGFTSPTAGVYLNGLSYSSNLSNGMLLLGSGGSHVFGIAQVQEDITSGLFTNLPINGSIKKVKVEGSKVMIELDSYSSLMTGKKLVVSVGRVPKVNGLSFTGGNFVQLQDPAGNNVESGNTSTSDKIEVSGVQRATIIN